MAILIVDCDDDRRPLLAQCVAQASGGVTPLMADALPQVLNEGTLIICHVGNRQHDHEARSLGQKLRDGITNVRCIVAGFTGGNISPHFVRQMPPQGNEFVINDRASSGEVNDLFRADILRLVQAWKAHTGRLNGEWLAQAWIGYDPGLEAILELLSDLIRGEVAIDGVDDELEHLGEFGIGDIDADLLRASVSSEDDSLRLANIEKLRDRLFRNRSGRGAFR